MNRVGASWVWYSDVICTRIPVFMALKLCLAIYWCIVALSVKTNIIYLSNDLGIPGLLWRPIENALAQFCVLYCGWVRVCSPPSLCLNIGSIKNCCVSCSNLVPNWDSKYACFWITLKKSLLPHPFASCSQTSFLPILPGHFSIPYFGLFIKIPFAPGDLLFRDSFLNGIKDSSPLFGPKNI